MAKKKDVFPPLVVVSGGEVLLRRRFVQNMVSVQRAEGWSIENVDGSDPSAVRDVLAPGLFVPGKVLAVVHTPEKIDLDLVGQHQASKDYTTTLLLHLDGEPDGRTKFGKFLKGLGDVHKTFTKPTEWKAPEVAVEFVLAEALSYRKTMRPSLAEALVERVGSDLGMLAFELQKMALLADARGLEAIDKAEVRGGMAPIAEASVGPIADALALRNRKRLSKALSKVHETTKTDPTMRISRFLGAIVLKWMQAAHLDALPPKAAAQELGLHPWYFETKILPPARRWGKARTVQLVADLAAAERAVFNGAINPWVVLTSRLLSSC